jgi:hypothetical protein
LGDVEEQDAIPLLGALGLRILRLELRQYAFRLPRRAGIQVLDVSHLAAACHALGLTARCELSNAPLALRNGNDRALLFTELERLLGRKKPHEHQRAIETISSCAIFLADDGALWPAKDIFSSGEAHQTATTVVIVRIGELERKDTAATPEIERRITLIGGLSAEQRQRLLEIADLCPVHKSLTSRIDIQTELVNPSL